ncbi:MAG TPA: DEAD/DEAH box helicase [Jiangellaceae bacterium]|nr:DEAD/DEAH box helicase [Jiangellaceae bacterium]
MCPPADLLAALTAPAGRLERVTHVEVVPARAARTVAWPDWLDPQVRTCLEAAGISRPWAHQVDAARHAWSGRSVVVATGTASGKSLAYLLPALTAARQDHARTLYLSPTKALASDQLRALEALAVPDVLAATYDGDTPVESRDFARAHATYLLTNPDMVHRSILPRHHRWVTFLRALRFVVVDECHGYRGVFGSHVAQVLRRLRRVCALYGSEPVFVLASATTADPAASAGRLAGVPVAAVTADESPRGETAFALWEPPLLPPRAVARSQRSVASRRPGGAAGPGENGAPVRRSTVVETADLLADLVLAGARAIAFVRSRRSAETVATLTRAALAPVDPDLPERVAAYRAGYLGHERRALEARLQDGTLRGVAATTALELGVDVAGLDAVLMAGWPGTRASMWQQAGRAGRAGQGALAVLIARDDPLDTYLVNHPEAVFGHPVEATVLDPDNRYVLAPHLCAAAAESPLTDDDVKLFGPSAPQVLDLLERRRLLRHRSTGWYWTRRDWASDLADLRGAGGDPVRLVEVGTGRLLGTVDEARAHVTVHSGAVYVHQGETYVVESLDLDHGVAVVRPDTPDYTTTARDVSDLRVLDEERTATWGAARLAFGSVEVSSQVVGLLKRRFGTGEVLGEEPLDLPPRELRTRAVWWSMPDPVVAAAGVSTEAAPGAAHAAEHAAIGMLPLVATCDRWDIGGMSTARHADTGMLTVFVHDGHPGGAGFAERGFDAATAWLRATRDAITACPCPEGCPSCVQSPKCGNGNDPLDKTGAVRLLDALLAEAPAGPDT